MTPTVDLSGQLAIDVVDDLAQPGEGVEFRPTADANHAVPVIPAAEYRQRWAHVHDLMGEHRIDLLVAYADDRAVFGPAHARWLADLPVHFEPVCILVAPGREPILVTGPETVAYALLAGQLRDVRAVSLFTHPDEDYPYARIYALNRVLDDLVGGPGSVRRVGLAGQGLMSAAVMAGFRQALPQAEFVDVETPMCELRACKTTSEIAIIRHAYRIAELGLQAAVDAIAVGVTERQVVAAAEAAMRQAGAEGTGIDTIVASGPHARPILARSTFRRIVADDLVLLTVAPRFQGYHAAIGRPVLVGNPGPEIRRARDVAIQAQEACARAVRAGVEGRAVEAVGRRIVEAAGFGSYFLYSGVHSVGVIEFEPPIFGPSSSARIEKDMVISIDIPLFDAPWGGLRIEDGYLIGESGAEHLNLTPYVIEK
jgi:Xaa-Pro aminopeptidase